MASVFSEDVVKLIEAEPVSDESKFGGRTYFVPENSVVTGASGRDVVINTVGVTNDENLRRAFVGALVGTLVQRQKMWGPIFNYPRTLLVTPDAGFGANEGSFGGMWLDNLAAPASPNRNPYDYDQVVWLSATYKVIGLRTKTPIMVEVAVMRFHHESRKGADVNAELSGVRYIAEKKSATPDMKILKMSQGKTILGALFGNSTDINITSEKFVDDVVAGGDASGYLKYAGATLELLMRERTLANPEDYLYKGNPTPNHVDPEIIYKAVAASQMPYAEKDLNEATRQPNVMPGHASTDDILNVLEKVVGFGGMPGTTQGAIPSTTNPYEAIGAWDGSDGDSDIDEEMPRPLTPFSDSEDEFTF